MTINEAAKAWDLSPNWIRELIKSGRLKARLREDVPVPYYEIPDSAQKPPSMQQSPRRKGSPAEVKTATKVKRLYRAAAKARAVK